MGDNKSTKNKTERLPQNIKSNEKRSKNIGLVILIRFP